eukprot:c54196_g1_i1.p2 GENE.c54196_g1_i1~~c54196_g1_i1.p2  ORF type:complete len:138 (+),score=4.76 c54196_g1_i1:96-509(+)
MVELSLVILDLPKILTAILQLQMLRYIIPLPMLPPSLQTQLNKHYQTYHLHLQILNGIMKQLDHMAPEVWEMSTLQILFLAQVIALYMILTCLRAHWDLVILTLSPQALELISMLPLNKELSKLVEVFMIFEVICIL